MQISEHGGVQWSYQVSLWPPEVENDGGVAEFFIPLLLSQLFERMTSDPKKVPTVFHMPTKYFLSPLVTPLPVLIP